MLETKPVISLQLAKLMIAASEDKARKQGWKMNIAIVNDGGNLILFEHMDGAFLGGIHLAQRKALTSANFPISTRQFAGLAFGTSWQSGIEPGIADAPGILAIGGGLPIMTAANVHIGGIGVSGGTSDDQDEGCAQAGLDAVKDFLTAC